MCNATLNGAGTSNGLFTLGNFSGRCQFKYYVDIGSVPDDTYNNTAVVSGVDGNGGIIGEDATENVLVGVVEVQVMETIEFNGIPKGYYLSTALWSSSTVSVCWENPDPSNVTERGWVQDAIENSWDAYSGINITGWGNSCASSGGANIRIRIEDTGPHTHGLGNNLNNVVDVGFVTGIIPAITPTGSAISIIFLSFDSRITPTDFISRI